MLVTLGLSNHAVAVDKLQLIKINCDKSTFLNKNFYIYIAGTECSVDVRVLPMLGVDIILR